MANLSESISRFTTSISIKHLKFNPHGHRATVLRVFPSRLRVLAASSNDDLAMRPKKSSRKAPRTPKRLITVSTSGGSWQGQWSCDYVFSLRELRLADLAEEESEEADVFVNLTIQKHTGFGFSVDGRITTSFNRKCSCCSSLYCKEIDTTIDVWVLPSNKNADAHLPEIGGNDPSVIYVQPGSDADLDSLVQDTIRLAASGTDTCSESCEKAPVTWHNTDDGKMRVDQRWSRLLEIKNTM